MSDYFSLIQKINKQWHEAEEYFKTNEYAYKSYNDLKALSFYNWMFQVLENAIHTLVIDSTIIKTLYRAATGSWSNYNRFIPNKQFAAVNRMNGKDKLCFYFGASYKPSKREAIVTCIKEIRAKDEIVSVCSFKLKNDGKDLKIIDFTQDTSIPQDEKGLENYLMQVVKREGKDGLLRIITKVLVNFLSHSIAFEPINKEALDDFEIKHKYIPFWALTDYLELNGYDGLLYSSTVCSGGKNLALFNINKADYVDGSIETFNSDDYLNHKC